MDKSNCKKTEYDWKPESKLCGRGFEQIVMFIKCIYKEYLLGDELNGEPVKYCEGNNNSWWWKPSNQLLWVRIHY